MDTLITACANQKGGVGKTTTTVNLSACLAECHRRVLLVDLDPQANATSGLGAEKSEEKSVYRSLLGEGDVDACILSTGISGLDIIPAEINLAGAEVDIARMDNYLHRLRACLAPLVGQNRYEHIILDCPPSLGILTMNALAAADELLIPIQCEYYALEGLSTIVRLVNQLREGGVNPSLKIEGIVMTMHDTRTRLSQQVVQEVTEHFGEQLYQTLIPRTVRLSEAPSYGLPIIAYDERSTGAEAYRRLAGEYIERHQTPPSSTESDPAPTDSREEEHAPENRENDWNGQ